MYIKTISRRSAWKRWWWWWWWWWEQSEHRAHNCNRHINRMNKSIVDIFPCVEISMYRVFSFYLPYSTKNARPKKRIWFALLKLIAFNEISCEWLRAAATALRLVVYQRYFVSNSFHFWHFLWFCFAAFVFRVQIEWKWFNIRTQQS